jgi:plastocyanin
MRVVAATVVATLCTCSSQSPQPRSWTVDIQQFLYAPASLDVAIGDTVRWINRDLLPHSVTAPDSTWDSGQMNGGEAWQVVITAAHDGEYICSFHPGMKGMLRVSP